MTSFYCDRCANPINTSDSGHNTLVPTLKGPILNTAPTPLRMAGLDLCEKCASAFVVWFQAGEGRTS